MNHLKSIVFMFACFWVGLPMKLSCAAEILIGDTNYPEISTFTPGTSVKALLSATGLGAYAFKNIEYKISDEYGTPISSSTIWVHADENGNSSVSLSLPSSKLGYYRVDAQLSDGTLLSGAGTRPAGFMSYAVVPDPASRTSYSPQLSHFGLQMTVTRLQTNSPVPYLGVRWVFGREETWTSLEPDNPGEFVARRAALAQLGFPYPGYDGGQENLTFGGKSYITYFISPLTIANTPAWARGVDHINDFYALNAVGLQGIDSFLSASASAFIQLFPNQSQKYYQVTWEPQIQPSWTNTTMTAGDLTQYYSHAYNILHSQDPNAVVAGPTMFPDDSNYDGNCPATHTVPCSMQQLQELLSAGLAKYIDVFTLHPYCTNFPPEAQTWLSSLRAQTAAVNKAAGRTVPFVGTEHGYTTFDSLDPGIGTYLAPALGSVRDPEIVGDLNKALGDIRMSIMMVGEGAAYDIGFYLTDNGSAPGLANTNSMGFYWNLDPANPYAPGKIGPKPIVPAYAAMTNFLDGSTTKGPVAGLSGTQMGYRFVRGGKTILALWDYGTAVTVAQLEGKNPQSDLVCNWMGNCAAPHINNGKIVINLGPAPVYVMGADL